MSKVLAVPAIFCIILLNVILPDNAEASNILMVFPIVSKSHFKVGEALTLGLARAGHDVTLLCPFPYKPALKNIQVIQLTGAIELSEGKSICSCLFTIRY